MPNMKGSESNKRKEASEEKLGKKGEKEDGSVCSPIESTRYRSTAALY